VARAIADQLRAKVTGREEQVIAAKPTDNPEAYDAYLRGLAFEARSSYSIDLLEKATGFYERAVELDPNFALGATFSCGRASSLYRRRPNRRSTRYG
jgi:eukaryotic-like serine/threonine-protein kinase